MLWNIEEDRVISTIEYDQKQVSLTVRELRVKVSESKPNGHTNLMFPAKMFSANHTNQYKGYGNGNRNYDKENGNVKRGPQMYGRGQNLS